MRAAPKRLAAFYSVLGVSFIALLLRTLLAPRLTFDAQLMEVRLRTMVCLGSSSGGLHLAIALLSELP